MNKFEVVLIFNPDLATNSLNSEIENFKTKLTSNSAKIINEEDWGLRELSYSINKFKQHLEIFTISELDNLIITNSSYNTT